VTTAPLSTPWRARLETRLLLFATLVTGVAVVAMLIAAQRVITASAIERKIRFSSSSSRTAPPANTLWTVLFMN